MDLLKHLIIQFEVTEVEKSIFPWNDLSLEKNERS
jgi:hypothetical protein